MPVSKAYSNYLQGLQVGDTIQFDNPNLPTLNNTSLVCTATICSISSVGHVYPRIGVNYNGTFIYFSQKYGKRYNNKGQILLPS